jgi:histidyl-tRNA synthetase
LGKFLPDQDRPNEGVFSFQDDDEQWLSLRYDLTAPLARYVAENFDTLPKPYRSYRFGWVFRNEKPGPGRFRQFMQFDADTVGSGSVAADAEMCMMAADTLERVGIARGDYVVRVNNRKLLDGVMDSVGLSGDGNAWQRLTVLRALDKLDRLGTDEVIKLLSDGRKDESGDFTKGAKLNRDQIAAFSVFLTYRPGQTVPIPKDDGSTARRFVTVVRGENGQTEYIETNNERTIETVKGSLPRHPLIDQGLDELREIASLVDGSRVFIDPSVVRGLEYYTGPVYEAELTFTVTGDDGRPVRFGSVGGGGRYDGLIGRFRAEPVPATGFSIGVSRLLAALQAVKSPLVTGAEAPGPVVVLVMDRDRIADYQRMVARLRNPDDGGPPIRAELYLGGAGMKAQMKYADRRRSPCVIIQGSDERARGEVQIKDLALGAALAAGRDRADYLDKQAEAQLSVPEDEFVSAVRRILARRTA